MLLTFDMQAESPRAAQGMIAAVFDPNVAELQEQIQRLEVSTIAGRLIFSQAAIACPEAIADSLEARCHAAALVQWHPWHSELPLASEVSN